MDILRFLRGSGRRPARRPRRRPAIEFTPLEDRQLLIVASITAVARPKILPNNGRLVPVTVTGTIEQDYFTELGKATVPPPPADLAAIYAQNDSKPAPVVLELVTDQYGTIEPRVRDTASHLISNTTFFVPYTATNPVARAGVVKKFAYSFTVFLQAKANGDHRQYAINMSASDEDTTVQKNLAVLVQGHRTPPRRPPVHPGHAVHPHVRPRGRG